MKWSNTILKLGKSTIMYIAQFHKFNISFKILNSNSPFLSKSNMASKDRCQYLECELILRILWLLFH